MKGEKLTPIETALQYALNRAPETDQLSADEIVEVAELGRKHPEFDRMMARISRSPSSLAIYAAARETLPATGLKKAAEAWMEGAKRLPLWFDSVVAGLNRAPSMAYRSAAAPIPDDLRLVSPNPVNQSILSKEQAWKTAGNPDSVVITVEDAGVDGTPSRGEQVIVTIAPCGDVWSLEFEVTYRFRVLSEAEVEKAKWASENAQQIPVASAMVFCSLGLFSEAERLLEKWPADGKLQPFAEVIRRACQARMADARQLYL